MNSCAISARTSPFISMLRKVIDWVKGYGLRLNNLDATVVAERPKLALYLPTMRERIAEAFEASINQVNIKATTTEGMGFCGRQEGIEAFAVIGLEIT